MSFPRYPKYKDSGVEWLGEVPEHWVPMPIRMAAKLESGHTPSRSHPEYWEDCTVPWFTLADVWQIRKAGRRHIVETKEMVSEIGLANSSARLLPKGTVMLSRTASVGFAAIMGRDMATTQDFANWICSSRLIAEFLHYTFLAMKGEFRRSMMGSTHNTIYMPDIQSLRFVLPPKDEQTAIAAFLDRETAKIDGLVAEQRRLMELLKEKRQAVISHAVTKGLNPDAPMKPSGIEWLGDVPEHWEVMKLGRVTLDRCDGPFGSGLKSSHYVDEGIRVIRLNNIRHDFFDNSDVAYIDPDHYYGRLGGGHDVVAGDLLIAGLGDAKNAVGRTCVAPSGIEPAMVKADCFRYRLNEERALSAFMSAQLTVGAPTDAGLMSTGTTRSRMPLSITSSRKIAFPSLDEQRNIVDFIHARSSEFDALTTEAQRAIDLLKERRTALISAAVTGQIDVREFAGEVAA